MSDPNATIGIRASDRKLKSDLRRARRTVKHFGKDVKSSIGGAFKGGFATVGSFAAVGGMTHLLKSGMQYQTTLQRLGDQAKKNKPQIADLDKMIRAQASAWGLTNEQMLGATAQLVNLQGGAKATEENMAFLAEAMTATGATAANTSRVMSALMDQGIETPKAMRDAFDALIAAGDEGNIPFDKMADKLSSILPILKGLVSEGKQGQAELGGFLQVIGKVTGGDIAKAETMTNAMVDALKKPSDELRKKFGDLFNKDGNVKNLYEIRDVLARLSKHDKFTDLISSSEARKAIKAVGEYKQVWADVHKASMKSHDMSRKAHAFRLSSAGKWRAAMARIQNKFAEMMTPERIDKVADAAGYLADGLGLVADNVGLVVGAWAAWKGLGLVKHIGEVSGAFTKMGGVAGKAGNAVSMFKSNGVVGLGAAVLGAGYALGTYVDRVTGLSDKLAGIEPADNRTNLEKGRQMESRAIATRDWLKGVQSGKIQVSDRTRAVVKKRMSGQKLSVVDRRRLQFISRGAYNENKQNWESALAESQKFIVPATNKSTDAHNARVRDKARELVDSGSAVSTLRDMALGDNKDGAVDWQMIEKYMASQGLDAHRRVFARTGDAEADKRLADDREKQERTLDAELVQMLVKAIEGANLQVKSDVNVKADVSIDTTPLVEKLANSPALNRSY